MVRVLLYDADCGFCTRTSTWLASHGCPLEMVPWQQWPGLAEHGITEDAASQALHVVDGYQVYIGHRAIARALATCPSGVLRVIGRLIDVPALEPVSRKSYAALAGHRHRLPGGTEQCRLEPSNSQERS